MIISFEGIPRAVAPPLLKQCYTARGKRDIIRRVSPRNHLIMIHKGSGFWEHRGRRCAITGPCAFWSFKHERYHYGPHQEWDEFALGFGDEWDALASRLQIQDANDMPWPITAPRLVRDLCQQIELLSLSLGLPGAADSSDALAVAIVRGLQTQEARADEDPVTYRLLELADRWRRDSREPRSMDQVARECGLSPAHFRRRWRQQFGTPPIPWLTACRMEQAAELLSATSLSIGHIAESLGYPNQRYFAAVFRKNYQTSPGDYRRQGASHRES